MEKGGTVTKNSFFLSFFFFTLAEVTMPVRCPQRIRFLFFSASSSHAHRLFSHDVVAMETSALDGRRDRSHFDISGYL